MTFYLIETEDETGKNLYAVNDDEIDGELIHLISDAHYSGTGPVLSSLWRWDGTGRITPLILFRTGEVPELDDYLDWYYELRDPNLKVERKFIVRIDGRS